MATEVYGTSDDLIEVDGDVRGEVSYFGTDDWDRGVLLMCGDATVLEVRYGKGGAGLWGITVLRKGSKLLEVEQCDDEDAERHSDVARFSDGLKWVYAATEWELVS